VQRWIAGNFDILALPASLAVEELGMRLSLVFAIVVTVIEASRFCPLRCVTRWRRLTIRGHVLTVPYWFLVWTRGARYLNHRQVFVQILCAHTVLEIIRYTSGNNLASAIHVVWDMLAWSRGLPLLMAYTRKQKPRAQRRNAGVRDSYWRSVADQQGAVDALSEQVRDLSEVIALRPHERDTRYRDHRNPNHAGQRFEHEDEAGESSAPTRGSRDPPRRRGEEKAEPQKPKPNDPPEPTARPHSDLPDMPKRATLPPGALQEEFYGQVMIGRRVYFDYHFTVSAFFGIVVSCWLDSILALFAALLYALYSGRVWVVSIGEPVEAPPRDRRPDSNALSDCEHQSQMFHSCWYVLNLSEGNVFTERRIVDMEVVAQCLGAANTCLSVPQMRTTIRAFARRYSKTNVDRILVADEQFVVPWSADFATLLAEKMGRRLLAGPLPVMLCWPTAYGARVNEFKIPAISAVKTGCHPVVITEGVDRRPVATSLGPIFNGLKRIKLDPRDWLTMFLGAMKRVCKRPPAVSDSDRKLVRRFVRRWLKRHMTPIPIDSDDSFEVWLASTHYNEARKKELRRTYEEVKDLFSSEVTQVKCFIKDETYGEYKHARWIMSRTDYWKCFYGPLIRLVEAAIYENPAFVKHCTEAERAAKLEREVLRVGDVIMETDFTSFESHLDRATMLTLEVEMLDYMLSKHPGRALMRQMNRVVAGHNHLVARFVYLTVEARMSGEMSTSLGNGFTNLMIVRLVCWLNGNRHVRGLVEGDDGLFIMTGTAPTASMFARFGFTIKIKVHSEIAEAGFCGMLYDAESHVFVTDPAKVLLNFGWGTRQYLFANMYTRMALLRAKAMSYLCQYGSCPIISTFCSRIMELTMKVTDDKLAQVVSSMRVSAYEKAKLDFALAHPTSMRPVLPSTRQLFDRLFGVSVEDQLAIEKQMENLTLKPLPFPVALEHLVSDDCADYFMRFVIMEPHPYGLCPFSPIWDSRVYAFAQRLFAECR
jgi:hypothetical protein